MNVLFDLITTQLSYGRGATEYVRRIYFELQNTRRFSSCEINIYAAIDSSIGQFPYADLSHEVLKKECIGIIDIHGKKLSEIAHKYSIDTIFVGLSQVWAERYDLSGLTCKVITITHDLNAEEVESIRLFSYLSLFKSASAQVRQFASRIVKYIENKMGLIGKPLAEMFDVLKTNPNWVCVTVSEYSKHTLIFHHAISADKIKVLFSPERIIKWNDQGIENQKLKEIIESGQKYYLIVSASRPGKNARKAVETFKSYRDYVLKHCNNTAELPIIVTLGMGCDDINNGHIDIKSVSESDLAWAYKKCYALMYPSFFEGFGYPPVEAMKFGIPVLASNVTSIPEVLGDAPIYFSPFFKSDIFKAFCTLTDDNYKQFQKKSTERYSVICKQQNRDLKELLDIIINITDKEIK